MVTLPTGSIRFDNEGERLAHEIAQIAMRIPSNRLLSRVRFVVTSTERHQIRDYCMKRDGFFSGNIKGIDLVVDDDISMGLRERAIEIAEGKR